MYSKHSALGSRILKIFRNDDVMLSSLSCVFWKLVIAGGEKKSFHWRSKITISNTRFQNERRKFSRRGPRCSKYSEFGHFKLLFCRGRRRKLPTFITRAELLFCSLHLWLDAILVAVAVVVCYNSIVDMGHYFANGIIVSLTWGRNSYSGVFQNIFLFRNKVNRTHPKTVMCCPRKRK